MMGMLYTTLYRIRFYFLWVLQAGTIHYLLGVGITDTNGVLL